MDFTLSLLLNLLQRLRDFFQFALVQGILETPPLLVLFLVFFEFLLFFF